LVYYANVRPVLAVTVVCLWFTATLAGLQEDASAPKAESPKSEPAYSDTFSGPIVELYYVGDSTKRSHPDDPVTRITVSRSILGKPAEKRTFWIKTDTRIEGNLRLKTRVTVGYVVADEGNVARLIVVRATQKGPTERN
jgi:hypothetical protein